jgi:outer membrane lipoprotein-sorting protein
MWTLRAAATATALAMLFVPLPAAGATARELLDRVKALDDTTRHWTDRTEKLTLAITDARGGERTRELQIQNKRYAGDEDKALSIFLAPPEVKGTAFLQWSHKSADDDQWLYLPEFKRTRRITAQLRDESFMGTDFSYRDLEILAEFQRWSEGEAPSALTGEEPVDGSVCHVIALRPHQEGMIYGKLVLWLDRERLVVRRMDFFDKDDKALKSLSFGDLRDVGAVPTAHLLEMRNLEKGSRTRVTVSEVAYDKGLEDDVFTQRYLERGAP